MTSYLIVLCFFVSVFCLCLFFFFFKQKTAYEMRISDWSSDVCSSDLSAERRMAHVAGIQTSEAQPVAAAEWKQADVDNARHPREAVKSSRPKSSRPRASTVTPGPQAERGR